MIVNTIIITKALLALTTALLLTNCSVEIPEDSQTKEAELEELVAEYQNQEDLNLWSLGQIDDEIFDCEAKYYSNNQVEDAFSFCTCKSQMLAKRWGRDDYKRNSFAYDRRLAKTGRLAICLEVDSALDFIDTLEFIKEDRDFDVQAIETETTEAVDPVQVAIDSGDNGQSDVLKHELNQTYVTIKNTKQAIDNTETALGHINEAIESGEETEAEMNRLNADKIMLEERLAGLQNSLIDLETRKAELKEQLEA